MMKKIKRFFLLLSKRGLAWAITSSLGEFSLSIITSKILSRLFNIVLSPLVLLAGVHRNQLWSERSNALSELLCQFDSPVTVLEIGTWMGRGSTAMFLNQLPKGSSLVMLDSWDDFVKERGGEQVGSFKNMPRLSKIALMSSINQVDLHKNKNVFTTIIRAKSETGLPLLKPNYFDLIYIDGSHYFEDVDIDIKHAINLVKSGGIICGDDLDQLPTEYNYNIAKNNLEKDLFIFENGTAVHPGVLVAVRDNFSDNINFQNGFWWLKYNK